MAAKDFSLPFALKTVRSGLSARAGLRAFRAGGGRVADSTWFRTVAEVRRSLADSLHEATKPLNRRPTGDEITNITVPKGRGYQQNALVFVRDRDTGDVTAKNFSVRGRGLLTRKATLDAAVEAFSTGVTNSPESFNEEIIGAAYDSTFYYGPE